MGHQAIPSQEGAFVGVGDGIFGRVPIPTLRDKNRSEHAVLRRVVERDEVPFFVGAHISLTPGPTAWVDDGPNFVKGAVPSAVHVDNLGERGGASRSDDGSDVRQATA